MDCPYAYQRNAYEFQTYFNRGESSVIENFPQLLFQLVSPEAFRDDPAFRIDQVVMWVGPGAVGVEYRITILL